MKVKSIILGLSLLALIGCDANVPMEVTDKPNVKFGTFTDPRDGHVYKTVTIGSQTWLAENLRYYKNKPISYGGNRSDTEEKYYIYGFDGTNSSTTAEQNYDKYGILYNYPAAKASVPTGWRLPTSEDFETLRSTVGRFYNGKYWNYAGIFRMLLCVDEAGSYAYSASSGFNGQKCCFYKGDYAYTGRDYMMYWTSETYSYYDAYVYSIDDDYYYTRREKFDNYYGFPVRCIKK